MFVAVPQPEAGAADREGGLEEVLDFSIKEGRDCGGSHEPPQRQRGRPSHRHRGLHRRAAEAGWRPLSIGDWRQSTKASPGPTEAAPRAAPARTGYPDRMGPSSPKHVVLVLHQFINSLHKGTEPAPAPPHRDPGGGGGAASHHLAAEPEQVPQRPHLMLPQV